MNLLIDTHVFIWAGSGDRRMSKRAADHIANAANLVFVSVISHWETAAKARRHSSFRLSEPWNETMERYALTPLDLEFDVPTRIADLPDVHGDPFDRLLIAQALHHGLTLVTNDRMIRRYPVKTLW